MDNGNQLKSVCVDAIHETQQNGRYGVSLWEMVDKEEKNLFRVELFSLDDIRDTTQHTVTVQVLQTKLWTLADIAAFYVARQLKTKRRMEILRNFILLLLSTGFLANKFTVYLLHSLQNLESIAYNCHV